MAKTKLRNILSKGLRTFTIISAVSFTCQFGLITGTALAQSGMGSAPSSVSGQTAGADSELYKKQAEIDQYLFKDHQKEIDEKGFKVIYTAITDTNVEIGIIPMNDGNASYLYHIFGNDTVKVVAASEVSTCGEVPPDAAAADDGSNNQTVITTAAGTSETGTDSQIVTTTAAGTPETGTDSQIVTAPVAGTSEESLKRDTAAKENEAGSNGEVQIQIEAADEGVLFSGKPEAASEPTAAASESTAAAKVTSTAADMAVKTAAAGGQHRLSAPVVILMIAGTAILAGCAIIIFGRKRM